ncbi:MAG: histone-like nucleoid-structuring protein Lsr2 [Brachybacterium tyrofermentans]
MARKTQIVLTDDLDGSAATTTVEFSLDGVSYEIDLNDDHATKIRESLAPWLEHGRRTGGRARRRTSAARGNEVKKIREWAQANGHEVANRGRISAEIRAAYEAAGAKG